MHLPFVVVGKVTFLTKHIIQVLSFYTFHHRPGILSLFLFLFSSSSFFSFSFSSSSSSLSPLLLLHLFLFLLFLFLPLLLFPSLSLSLFPIHSSPFNIFFNIACHIFFISYSQSIWAWHWLWMSQCLLLSPKSTCVLQTSYKRPWSYLLEFSSLQAAVKSQSSYRIMTML